MKEEVGAGDHEFAQGEGALARRAVYDALKFFDKAQVSGFNADRCAGARWYCWMLAGQFEHAWLESDSIALRGAPAPLMLWDGKSFTGKRVIVRCLHGLGDAIQFVRYAQPLRAQAARVIVETHPEMVPLLSQARCVDNVVTWRDGSSKTFDAWDQQIEVMELPRAFCTTVDTIPHDVPYLSVNAGGRRAPGGPPRVGVLWASSQWNPARSVPFQEFRRILEVPDVSFFSFQRGRERADLGILDGTIRVFDTAEHSPGILDSASDLMETDLLITVDTMLAHLAGALGRPVWTLLPFEADWRWMLARQDSPWYPSMRLFRQRAPGEWGAAVDRVIRELVGWVTER